MAWMHLLISPSLFLFFEEFHTTMPSPPHRTGSGEDRGRPGSSSDSRGSRDSRHAQGKDQRQHSRPSPRNAERDLAMVDQKLLDLLEERARITAAMRAGKKGRAPSEQHLEQRLWQAWEERANRSHGDKSRWRALFTMVQDLPPPRFEEADQGVAGFQLAPRPEPVAAAVDFPIGIWESQAWALLAVQAGTPASLSSVALNAPVVYLAKALNHAGSGFRWQHDQLDYKKGEDGPFALDGKALFVGDDLVSCCGLLFLALGKHARLRVTGETALKLTDLSPIGRFVTTFQARLTPVVPGSKGLPVRLESAGLPPEVIDLPGDLPPEAFWALACTAPSYEHGLIIRFEGEIFQSVADRAAALLSQCLPGVEVAHGELRIPHGVPTLPPSLSLPVDPLLATSLLALPLCSAQGGIVTLNGYFPAHLAAWRHGAALLEAAGLSPSIGPAIVRASLPSRERLTREASSELRLDSVVDPAYFPLAFAIAASRVLLDAGTVAILRGPLHDEESTACEELASRLGLRLEMNDTTLRIAGRTAPMPSAAPWLAPNAAWAFAYTCLSLARPGLPLANPGSATELLPRFWNFYNTLPTPPQDVLLAAPPPITEGADGTEDSSDGSRANKRRIRLRTTHTTPRRDPGPRDGA